MSTIDLDRLIVRQTYFIPVEASKLLDAIFEELRASERKIRGVYPWVIEEEHKNSFCFNYYFGYLFVHDAVIGLDEGTREFKTLVKQKSNEYTKELPKIFFKILRIVPNS